MIKWILNVFKGSEIHDLKTNKLLPLSEVDNFLINLQKPLNNLLSFVKDTYSFDTVTYYSFEQPFSDYSKKYRLILEAALCHFFSEEALSSKLESLKSFNFIICNRNYDNVYKSVYIPISHFYDPNGNLRILFSNMLEFNLDFLKIKFIDLNGKIKGEYRTFLEYREIYNESSSEVPVFRTLDSVFSAVISVRKTSPILDFDDSPYDDFTVFDNRDADFIIKKYFDQHGVEYCLLELRHANIIIKSKTIKIEHLVFDIEQEVDDFLFPLLETSEMLAAIQLTPEFSPAFMSQDFSDFIALKNMTII